MTLWDLVGAIPVSHLTGCIVFGLVGQQFVFDVCISYRLPGLGASPASSMAYVRKHSDT